MTLARPDTGLELRSLVTSDAKLELSLVEVPISAPEPERGADPGRSRPDQPVGSRTAARGCGHERRDGRPDRQTVPWSPRLCRPGRCGRWPAGWAFRCRSETKAPARSSRPGHRRRAGAARAGPSRWRAGACTRSTGASTRRSASCCRKALRPRRRLLLRQPADRAGHGGDDAPGGPHAPSSTPPPPPTWARCSTSSASKTACRWSTSSASPSRKILLRAIGAVHVCNSTSPSFMDDLTEALAPPRPRWPSMPSAAERWPARS